VTHPTRSAARHHPFVMTLIAGLLCCAMHAGPVRADSGIVGGFPQIPATARGVALAGNMTVLAEGSEAIQWNPAGLLNLEHREIGFGYSDLFGLGLVTHTVVNFGWPFLGKEVRWENGRIRKVPLPPPAHRALGLGVTNLRAGLGDDKSYRETQILLAYAWRMPAGVRAGATFHYLTAQSAFSGAGGSGYGFDLGFIGPLGPLEVGLTTLDIASSVKWDEDPPEQGVTPVGEENAPLPQRWGLGLAWRPSSIPLALTVQGDWRGSFHYQDTGAGAEWHVVGPLTLRAGARHREDTLGGYMDWSAGAGFRVGSISFDYGWLDNGRDLGATQRWSAAIGL
jgi:hypothetical protein